jgi:alanine racemase
MDDPSQATLAPSYIELSRSAVHHNIDFLRQHLAGDVRITCVVKGNAYGHGIEKIVPLLEEAGINHFAVYNADEALRVKKAKSPESDIMIMGMIPDEALEWALANDIELYIFEADRLKQLLEISKETNEPARIHLHLETGMNRMGLEKEQFDDWSRQLTQNREHFHLSGVCTHLAGAEHIANHVRIESQFEEYQKILTKLKAQDLSPDYRHVVSSAGAMRYPNMRLDMIRIGIMQYGFWSSTETFIYYVRENQEDRVDPLENVISWKSSVMNVKDVESGEFIGYGNSYMARQDMKVAGVPVGYATGYARSLSNTGRILINGHRVDVVGTVNMNMLIADISDVPETEKGDEVVLIGKQGKQSISVAPFGEVSDNMDYERLTKLSSRIPRIIVE